MFTPISIDIYYIFKTKYMKDLVELIRESYENKMKKYGFEKHKSGREIWFETTYKHKLIAVLQEEEGKDDWWNVRVDSTYLLNADGKYMSFETPEEAAEEAIEQIDNKMI